MELQTAKHTGSARCSDFFHNLMPASPDVRRACHDSVQVTETIIYHCMTVSAWVTETFIYCRLCWRFVVMTVPFTQEIKFKHLRNNSQLDKYHSIDIVRDQSAEFNYSNLKTWPRDVIDCHCWSTRVTKLQQPCLCFIPSSYISFKTNYHPQIFVTLSAER